MTNVDHVDAAAQRALRHLGADPVNWVQPSPGIDHDVVVDEDAPELRDAARPSLRASGPPEAGAAEIVRPRSAALATVTGTVTVLFAGFGSLVSPGETVAVLVIAPVAEEATFTARVIAGAVVLATIVVARVQVTAAPTAEQLHPTPLAET